MLGAVTRIEPALPAWEVQRSAGQGRWLMTGTAIMHRPRLPGAVQVVLRALPLVPGSGPLDLGGCKLWHADRTLRPDGLQLAIIRRPISEAAAPHPSFVRLDGMQ